MIRYLLNVSYIGTAFRGVTFIEPYYRYRDLRTVQGTLENAAKYYFKKRCAVSCSSRTDARVHAINSTFHVDVEEDCNLKISSEADNYEMIATLNDNLKFQRAAIRINEIEIVDEHTFMAHRNVESRTYLYRLAIIRENRLDDFAIPIELIDRCYIIESDSFDIEKFKLATTMFIGTHDFRSFMRYSKEQKTHDACYAQRRMISITVKPSTNSGVFSSNLMTIDQYYQFYDIIFTANSYVYRQIRRIMGALCAVGLGKIMLKDIYELLTIPSHNSWEYLRHQNLVETAPAFGLYFTGITYKTKDEWTLNLPEKTSRGSRVKSFFDRKKFKCDETI